jgi:hypothetical protein
MATPEQVDALSTINNSRNKKPVSTPTLTPQQVDKLREIKTRAGWIPVDQQVALARSNASTDAIDAVGNMNAKQIVELQASDDDGQNWLSRNVYSKFKAASRWTTAALNFVPEFIQGGTAQFRKPGDTLFEEGWFTATTLGTMIQNPELRGEGFFGSQELFEKQAEKARKYRGTVNGSAWTVGRGAANLVFKPNSLAYNLLSGFVDAAVMIKTDPTGPATKLYKGGLSGLGVVDQVGVTPEMTQGIAGKLKYGTLGKNLVPLVSETEAAPIRAAMLTEAGLTSSLSDFGLDGSKFDRFSRTNGRMVELVNRLAEEKDPLVVAERLLKGRTVPNELVVALSKTEDPEAVRSILASLFSIGRGALPADIRVLQKTPLLSKAGDFAVERLPLVDGIRKSRYFTTAARGKIVVNGSSEDNANAVKTIVSYLRTAGVDDQTVSSVANQAFSSFTETASDVARKNTLDTFENVMRTVMKADGIADEVIESLFENARSGVDKTRRYLLDRLGMPTDNGYASYLTNENFEFLTGDQINTMISDLGLSAPIRPGDITIVSPTQLVEMLDRVQVLPDIRDVRRLTRNKLFRTALSNNFVTDQKLYDDLTKRIADLSAKDSLTETEQNSLKIFTRQKDSLVSQKSKIKKVPFTAKGKRIAVETITDQTKYDEISGQINGLRKIQNKSQDVVDQIDRLNAERNALKEIRLKRVATQEQRALVEVADFMQNRLWKGLALATGGYVVRNSFDAQIRMAFAGLPSVFNHPFEYLALVLGSSKKMTLQLEDISKIRNAPKDGDIIREGVVTVNDLVDDVRDAMTFGLRKSGYGPSSIDDTRRATGSFEDVNRMLPNGVKLHTDGVVQNGLRVSEDPFMKVALQTFVEYGGANQQSRDTAARKIVNIILKDSKLRKQVDDAHLRGFEVTAENGRKTFTPPINLKNLSEDDQWSAYYQYAMRLAVDPAQMYAGMIPESEFIMAFNYMPTVQNGRMVGAYDDSVRNITLFEGENLRVGALVDTGNPNQPGVVTRIFDEVTGDVVIDPEDGVVNLMDKRVYVQPVMPEKPLNANGGTRDVRKLFENMPVSDNPSAPGLPSVIKREPMMSDPRDVARLSSLMEAYDKNMDWFFGDLYGAVTRKLDRSPVFREAYYRTVYKHVERMKPEDASKLLDEIGKRSKTLKMSSEEYVGDKKLIGLLQRSSKTSGDISLEELDDYAKFEALTQVKELLYDASERSNFEDVIRIIMPFAPAWREIITTYAGFLRQNPLNTGRQFQRVYTGLSQADPDNDGRGFFYRDPQTDQMMFMFPASGYLSKALTGLYAPLEAPVGRLSQGIQAFPALGPMAQVAASKILPLVPKGEEIAEILLPYGYKDASTAFNPTPQWLNKGLQTITAPTNNLETVFANTYIETYRALSASGDYDLNNSDDLRQMEKDAKNKARILTAFRSLSQFLGPTAGATEFKIDTKEGDVYVGQLIKEFNEMQADPAIGYDRAVPEFLDRFGDEVALYVASKSRSVAEGLEATKEFQDWSTTNAELIRDYESVARYLAPEGSDFVFAVWNAQIQKGERVRLSEREIKELSDQRIGAALMRSARRRLGPYPDDMGREILTKYRSYLHTKYPGFPEFVEFTVGKFYNDVRDLENLVDDNRVSGDTTAGAISQYLAARRQAIAAAGVKEQGFRTSKSALSYRNALAAYGSALAEQVPNFARIYDRLLASEVE